MNFGKTSYYVGYNALLDFFPNSSLKPNPDCENSWCRKSQQVWQEKQKSLSPREEKQKVGINEFELTKKGREEAQAWR